MIGSTITLTARALAAVLRGDADALDIAWKAADAALRDVPYAEPAEAATMALLSGALHDALAKDPPN